MKESIKTVFQCDFCDKRMFRKNAMENHELVCSRNPKNVDACLGCGFCQEIEKEIYVDDYSEDGYHVRAVRSFKCTKLDQLMYPNKAQKAYNKYPESFENEIMMPNECEHFEYMF